MLSERWRRVSFSHLVVARKRWLFLNATPKQLASRRVSCAEFTPVEVI